MRGPQDKPYARRNGIHDGRRIGIYLHREVLGLNPGDPRQGDHVNGHTLDCRRSNLRLATNALNAQNRRRPRSAKSSQYRNVTWDKTRQKWLAQATVDGKYHHIGRFDSEEDANAAAMAWRAQHMPFSQEAA